MVKVKKGKRELIEDVALRCGMTRVAVRQVLNATSSVVHDSIRRGDDVFLFGLGKLGTVQRGVRKARDIWKGTSVEVPPRIAVRFRPSDSLIIQANAGA